MASQMERKIICREIPNSRTVRSFIEKRVGEWLRKRGYDEQASRYHVILDREGGGHLVSCHIEVVSGAERWTGDWAGSGLHQALLKALNHMIPGPSMVPAHA
jgi:hypothetical protein